MDGGERNKSDGYLKKMETWALWIGVVGGWMCWGMKNEGISVKVVVQGHAQVGGNSFSGYVNNGIARGEYEE